MLCFYRQILSVLIHRVVIICKLDIVLFIMKFPGIKKSNAKKILDYVVGTMGEKFFIFHF